MARRSFHHTAIFFIGILAFAWARDARAAPASVTVGQADGPRFASPPPGRASPEAPVAIDASHEFVEDDKSRYQAEVFRSLFRLQLGPAAVTTGRGLGMGLGLAADFGHELVGLRIAAAWVRGEKTHDGEVLSVLGSSLAQYTGELTLDLNKRGPVHPVLGAGFGLVHVNNAAGGGNASVGTARFGLEYALGFDEADVRFGASITGALAGPADKEVGDLRTYALVDTHVAIGF